MKAEYIIRQLVSELAKHTDLFTDEIPVATITAASGVVTVVTTAPHGLVSGSNVTVQNVLRSTPIVALTQSGGVGEGETATNHDLTEGFQDTVRIEGANEAQYNGTFPLLSVPNRLNFTFDIDPTAPSPATGSPVLIEDVCDTFNGTFAVTVVDAVTFTYESPDTSLTGAGFLTPDSFIRGNHRISGAVDVLRAINSYTRQPEPDDLWAFVILGELDVNRDRSINTDVAALYNNPNSSFRQRVIQDFFIYVITPSTTSISGRPERDLMHDVYIALNKSLLLAKFDTGTANTETSGVTTLGHTFSDYANAHYTHEFRYQMTADLIYAAGDENDTSFKPCTRAWRDVFIDRLNDAGTVIQETDIDLDNNPLP